MKVKQLLREYGLATWYGADGQLVRLLPMSMRVARARLKHGIGPFPFALLTLAKVPESSWDDYLIKKLTLDAKLRAVNPESMHRLARNKVLFHEHCLRAGLPSVPIICRVGGTPDPLGNVVENATDAGRFKALIESAPPRLFVKAIDGSYGADAFLIAHDNGRYQFEGRTGDAEDLFTYIKKKCNAQTGFIIQPQLRPHVKMLPFGSVNGLPTARIVTAMYPDGADVLFACLKIPVGTSITDNFAHGTGGNLLAGINVRDGTLTPASRSRHRGWPVMMQVDVHPDSGQKIAGAHLPFWTEMVETALRGQRSLAQFKTIGWDVAATSDGVVLVEANSTYDVDILQVAHQRGLKSEFVEKLEVLLR